MIDPALALQTALRAHLMADLAVVALVDPANIRDGLMRPDDLPALGKESSSILAKALEKQRKMAGMSYAQLGRAANVDLSQVSRICRGEFATITGNVMQICRALGVDPTSPGAPPERRPTANEEELLTRAVTQSVLALWDRTPQGARRVAKLLEDIVILAAKRPS